MSNLTSIVIPTRNEEKNIGKLLQEIAIYISSPYETLVVDDSDTGATITAALANNVSRIIRGQHKGLGRAILDGIEASQGDTVLVMDADLSHPVSVIPSLVDAITRNGYDMAIGSRYVKGGCSVGWELHRRIVSRVACLLALPITLIKDTTSGFFAFRKSLIEGVHLEPSSWKIMLEILLKTKPMRVIEVPITFEVRKEGKSKFNRKQMIAYLEHLVKLALYKYQKFLKFCIVGGIGAVITFSLTWILTEMFSLWYMFSLVLAVIVATISNFTLNTIWTFKVDIDPSEADYEWRSFYRGSIIQKWWKQSIAKTIWSWVPNASSLLDIGCGSSPIITNYYGEEIVGIDKNQSKLEFMKSKCPRHTFDDKDTQEYPDGHFDHILCIEVMEHLHDPGEMISEIARLTKDGGQIVIATPDYSKWLWKIAERFTPYKEEHIFQFTKESLEKICSDYGLQPVRHKYIAGCDLCEEFVKVA